MECWVNKLNDYPWMHDSKMSGHPINQQMRRNVDWLDSDVDVATEVAARFE